MLYLKFYFHLNQNPESPAMKYDVHPGVEMIRKWSEELPEKTGRTLEQWADVVRQLRTTVCKERIAFLKEKHGLGTNSAMHIVDYVADRQTWNGDPEIYLQQAGVYVDDMFAGGKAELKPIFLKVLTAVRKLGKDVKVCPCKTIVPFYRNRVFGQVKPATKTRLELGLVLAGRPLHGLTSAKPTRQREGSDPTRDPPDDRGRLQRRSIGLAQNGLRRGCVIIQS